MPKWGFVAMLLVGCAGGGSDVDSTRADASVIDARSEASGDAPTGGCIFACEPPASSCTDDCSEQTFVPAGCTDANTCIFTMKATPCPYGCDTATGKCGVAGSGCTAIKCGEKTKCGGTCTDTKVCCGDATYDKTTGLAPSGSRACCNMGDALTGTTDCGTGVNHGVNVEGLCAVSWEGAGNGGTPCATAHCKGMRCPATD